MINLIFSGKQSIEEDDIHSEVRKMNSNLCI